MSYFTLDTKTNTYKSLSILDPFILFSDEDFEDEEIDLDDEDFDFEDEDFPDHYETEDEDDSSF